MEMGINRLRKSSASWPAVPSAEEENYVGLCCLQGALGLPNTYTDQGKDDDKKNVFVAMQLFI